MSSATSTPVLRSADNHLRQARVELQRARIILKLVYLAGRGAACGPDSHTFTSIADELLLYLSRVEVILQDLEVIP